MISRFCIQRPIFAIVLSVVIVIAGLGAMMSLPIAQYPEISPPQVTVSASYPGADADAIAQAVAAPIETQVNGVDNMLYMESSCSSAGQYSLSISFQVGTNPDTAQVQVQNRVSLALPSLPDTVQRSGVQTEKRSSTFLMIIGVYSSDGRYDADYVGNYANLYVLDALKRIPGANQASILGAPDLAMRIWLKPDRMASLRITPGDIARAVSAQNQQFGAGRIGSCVTNCGTVVGSMGTWLGEGCPTADVVTSLAVDMSPHPFVLKASDTTTTVSPAPDAKAKTRLVDMVVPSRCLDARQPGFEQSTGHGEPPRAAVFREARRPAGYGIRIAPDTRRTSRSRPRRAIQEEQSRLGGAIKARASRETAADRRRSSAASARRASAGGRASAPPSRRPPRAARAGA